jgi:enoyl-CoA hydratase/carnithine racemase
MADVLEVTNDGAVRTLCMNRPEKLNALDNALTHALIDALRAADEDDGCVAIVLTGAGRAFCAGADINEFKGLSEDSRAARRRGTLTMQLHATFSQIRTPVIAAVKGHAMGGGCGVAVACDLVLAGEGAKFGYPEIRRGAFPAVVMANLVRQVGPKAAFELAILGETLDAQKALSLGMINRVCPDAEVLDTAQTMAQTIAGFSRDAVFATKTLFHRTRALPLLPALEAARDANVMMRALAIRTTV